MVFGVLSSASETQPGHHCLSTLVSSEVESDRDCVPDCSHLKAQRLRYHLYPGLEVETRAVVLQTK